MIAPYAERPSPVGTRSVDYQHLPMPGGTADVFPLTVPALGGTEIARDGEWRGADRQITATLDLRNRFLALAREWHAATDSLSSPSEIAMHPAYKRIIGMGMVAVPFILEDLRRDGGQWFWALRAIIGRAPYGRESAGNAPAMKEAWLEWGRAHKLMAQ